MIDLSIGIAVDAAHSTKKEVTEIQGVDLETGDIVFYKNLGNQSVNIGEFLAIVEGLKYIIANNKPKILFSDSLVAIGWTRNKHAGAHKHNKHVRIAEIYLKIASYWVDKIQIIHWNNKEWGENPADFGNK